jgi:hypothetical protein
MDTVLLEHEGHVHLLSLKIGNTRLAVCVWVRKISVALGFASILGQQMDESLDQTVPEAI